VERGRFDLVYATSPPLPVGPAGLTVAALRRLPLVFEVRDLWPQVAADLGASGNSALLHVADRAARRCYRSAVRVVAVSEGYRPALFQAGVPEARLLVAPDGSNPDLFRFDEPDRRSVRSRLGIPEERFVGLFAGLHGLAYDLDTLLHAASLLSDQDFLFLCVGSGPAKAAARRRALRDGIRNVTFLPEQPRDEMPALLSAADAAVVPRRSFPSNDAAVPVRIFDALACSRPVLLGGRGEAARVLDESGGGITVRPGDPGALVQALRSMRDDPRGRRAMGRSGRQFIEDHGDRRRLARALIGELQRTFGSGRGETSGP
jgi:glycosyltransferase involved in cell wall biosynthesis